MRLLRRSLVVSFCALAVLVLGSIIGRVAERGRFTGAYSSHGGGPAGSRALYALLREMGVAAERWSQDLARLPAHSALVALGGCDAAMARPLSRYESEELVRWVDAGGLLIVAGARDYLPKGLGVRFAAEERCGRSGTLDLLPEDEPEMAADAGAPAAADAGAPAAADAGIPGLAVPAPALGNARSLSGNVRWSLPLSAALHGLSIVPMRDPGRILIDDGTAHELLLGVPRDEGTGEDFEPLGISLVHGSGRVIVLASASMLQNREIVSSDGGALFARLLRAHAPDARVLFDEYHLGVGERRTLMRYLREAGAMPLVAWLALTVALGLWRAGARFGAERQAAEPPPRGTASFVDAMGHLYASARDPAGAVAVLARQACARIAAHHHLPASTPRTLERVLRARGALAAADAVDEIIGLQQSSVTQRTRLVRMATRIDRACQRALAGGVGRPGAP